MQIRINKICQLMRNKFAINFLPHWTHQNHHIFLYKNLSNAKKTKKFIIKELKIRKKQKKRNKKLYVKYRHE